MKVKSILKSITAVCVSAAAMAAASVGVSAATADFEDGSYSFVTMKTDDGGDASLLSVEDYNGSKQLKVDVQDCSLLPKVQFDLNAMVGTDNLSDIDKILMDVTFVSKDGTTAPGWIGGALGTAGENDTPAWDQSDYEGGEYDNPASQPITVERKFLIPSKKPVSGTPNTIALLMRWASEVPYYMYIDNVRILDADGNEIAMAGASEPAAETDEAAAEANEPADDNNAAADDSVASDDSNAADDDAQVPAADNNAAADITPAPDSTTSSAATGNIPAASAAMITVCAAAIAAAAAKSRRK